MNSRMRYDLLVIGSGAAGHHGAIQGAKLGKRVAVVERGPWLGGATINTGTIPSKTVPEAAIRATNHGASLGDRIEHVASNESAVYANQFRRNEVDVLSGEASFVSPNLIRIKNAGESFDVQADRVLIATGTRPAHNPDIPVDGASILDTDAIRRLPPRKRAVTIVGGGVIGVEYACIAAQLEASVTLIERRPQVLEFIDHEIAEALSYHMRVKGVTFRLGEEVESVTKNPDGKVCATLKSGKQVWSDGLLYAVGRQGNTESLNLSAVGLEADSRGRIPVNDRFQTGQPKYLRGRRCHRIPEPGIGVDGARPRCGLSCFRRARAFGPGAVPIRDLYDSRDLLRRQNRGAIDIPYEVGIARYQEIARGQIIGDTTGLLKLLFHRETLRLLGVHIIGEGATELIHIGQTVLAFEGSVEFLRTTVFNYPTLAECYKVAALNGLNRLQYSNQPAQGVECATG